MNILKLQGLDGRLFDLVAPLVMNPAVLRQNNNYPFKTTRNHVWYIAMDEQRVLGFMPVKMTLPDSGFSGNPYQDMEDTSDCHSMSCSYILQTPLPGSRRRLQQPCSPLFP